MDKIFLSSLTAECVVGCWEWERHCKQKVVLDIELAADVRRAAATDRIEDALDYEQISRRLLAFIGDSHFHLIDTLAERCAQLLLDEFAVSWVRLTLSKFPGGLGVARVGVVIERSRAA